MATIGSVDISLDANIARLVSSLNRAESHLNSVQQTTNNLTNTLMRMASGAVGIYAVGSAFKGLLTSGMEANRMMENSEGKLFAMINSSKAYTDVLGNQLTATERLGAVNRETAMTMDLLTKANAETSMGMTELIDVYALMKPGMDRNKVAIQDQIQILKMVTNTAANFGVGADELANGIDDLADGTWKSNSGFGKMMKSLQLTQDEVKNTDNLLGLLTARMAETGAASDNMDTALSNLDVAWGNITGTLSKDIFGATKESIKVLTNMMGTDGVLASQAYAQSFKSLADFAVKAIGFIIKAINQMITLMQVAYKGYQQLGNYVATQGDKVGVAWNKAAVAVGEFVGLDVTEDKKDLADYNKALTERVGITKKLTEESNRIINANDNINASVNTMVASFTTYKATVKETNDIQVNNKPVVKAIDEVEKKVAKGTKARKKGISDIAKASKKANDDAVREVKRAEQEKKRAYEATMKFYEDTLSSMTSTFATSGGDIGASIKGALEGGIDMLKSSADPISKAIGYSADLLRGLLSSEEVAPDLGSDGSKGSESLSKALDNMNKVMYENLKYTKRMTASLSSIDKSFGGLGNQLSGMDLSASGYKGSSSSGIFSSKSTELEGTSLRIEPASIDKIVDGQIKAMSDVEIKVSKSSLFGLISSVSYDTTSTDVSESMSKYFSEATKGLINTFEIAADIIGNVDLSGLGSQVITLGDEGGKYNTSGKSGEEIAKLVEGGFSAEADRLAQNYFPMVEQFVQAGEAYVEALVRTSINFEQIGYQIGQMGKEVTYESSQAIVGVFGTLEDAQAGIASYVDLFYSEQEKADMQVKDMQNTFKGLGITMPKTKDEFRKLVESIDTTTEAGAAQYAKLIKLAPEYDTMTQAQKDLAQAEQDRIDAATEAEKAIADEEQAILKATADKILAERQSLEDKLFAMTATEIAIREKYISTLDVSNQSIQEAIYAEEDRVKAVEKSNKAMLDTKARIEKGREDEIAFLNEKLDLEKTNMKSLIDFNSDILGRIKNAFTGDLSYLSSKEKSEYLGGLTPTSTDDYLDNLAQKLELDKGLSTSREDYAVKFDSYINELQTAKQEDMTNADIVESINSLKLQNEKIEDAIARGSYQK